MCPTRQLFVRLSLLIFVLFHTGNIYGQLTRVDSLTATIPIIDTSDYIPSFYSGALEYNLMIAASRGYVAEIDRLIYKGADINAVTNERASALIFAVTSNKLQAVKALLKYNPQLDNLTSSFETPLLIAVKMRNPEIAEALIRAGASIDYTDRHGATSLHHAALNGYLDMVDLLLYYGANIDEKSVEGTTPLLASIWAGYNDVADLLIQNGADIEAKDNDGFTPFLMATFYGDTLMMNLLYKKGVNIYAINKSGHNALSLSIVTGQNEVTLFLLRIGNKWANQGTNAVNPYSVATKYHREEMVDILKNHKIPGQIKYEIDQIGITASSRFFINDFYTGLSLSFKEPWLNAGLIAGCDIKLWYTRVFIKNAEHLFYQYYDKGAIAYAGIFKDFALTERPDRINYSLSTSLLAGYSFGNSLKGTLIKPGNKFKVIPSISFKITKMNFSFITGVEYIKTEFYHNGPVWFRVGCTYNHFFDNVRIKVKPIKWY